MGADGGGAMSGIQRYSQIGYVYDDCWYEMQKSEDGAYVEYADHVAEVQQLANLLRLIVPHIPPTAIDGEKAMTAPIGDCYLNDLVRAALARLDGDIN